MHVRNMIGTLLSWIYIYIHGISLPSIAHQVVAQSPGLARILNR